MKQATSDLLAVAAIALVLAGVNDANPHQYHCLAFAAVLAVLSFKLNR
jgi:hypothetical membrane protein